MNQREIFQKDRVSYTKTFNIFINLKLIFTETLREDIKTKCLKIYK